MSASWRDLYNSKLTSAVEAVGLVKSGDTVNIPLSPPTGLLDALWERRDFLRDVRLQMAAPSYDPGWLDPDSQHMFSLDFELFIGDIARPVHDDKRAYYLPNLFSTGFKHIDEGRPYVRTPDVTLVTCSPPNNAGYVHFGPHHWTKRSSLRRAKLAIGEVDASFIQVHGDVYAHVSEFDCFVEGDPTSPLDARDIEEILEQVDPEYREALRSRIPELSEPVIRRLSRLPSSAIAQLVAPPLPEYKDIAGYLSELVDDGDCIQVGVGNPSVQMARLGVFDDRQDLGIHSELLVPGLVKLFDAGVINGRRKNQFVGKVVGTSWGGATAEEMQIIDDNPAFQLFDAEYILQIPRIAANDRQVSINNALSIDLLGQINAESVFGGRMINGTGGQPETHIGAFLSKGGKAITLLSSTAADGHISRIVPEFEPGSIVTIPRYFADTIVTEYGVARLLGKNHRERAEELIAVAHPDFCQELRKAAQRMFAA